MECYSAMRKKYIWAFAITWMDLEDIRLTEISLTKKDKYSKVSLIHGIRKEQIHKNRVNGY